VVSGQCGRLGGKYKIILKWICVRMNWELIAEAKDGICTRRGFLNRCWTIKFSRARMLLDEKILNVNNYFA